jgi:glutamate--cysteine ligase
MQKKLNKDNILGTFASYGCSKENQLIGGEYERTIVRPNGMPITYDEPYGIRWFLTEFTKRWGWTPKVEDQHIIALLKDGASITLEPGGQFELSGKPHKDLIGLQKEFTLNRERVNILAKEAGFRVITCGLTPIASIESISWMPKGRYEIMREYLPQKGDLSLFMMKGTTSVQCNYDFQNEQDCAKKVRVCAGLAPLTTAIFANSPLYRNRPTGYVSFRGHIWTRTDPDRTGFPPGLRDDFSFEQWVDYLLDVPMMFIHKGNDWIAANGTSFRKFMNSGIDGHFPSWEDWELHMTSVFPEVRIKRTIEVRGADCVSHPLAIAFCALFTGILYDNKALDDCLQLVEEFTHFGSREERFNLACKYGLQGSIGNKKILEWSEKMVTIAQEGLSRYQSHSQHLLEPLQRQISSGQSPGHDLLKKWQQNPIPKEIISAVQY